MESESEQEGGEHGGTPSLDCISYPIMLIQQLRLLQEPSTEGKPA